MNMALARYFVNRTFLIRQHVGVVSRHYSSPAIRGLGKASSKKEFKDVDVESDNPVETDSHKLVSEVCGTNLFNEGENIAVKSDSEYPEWLWNLHLGKPLELHEMNPNSLEYWLEVKRLGEIEEARLTKLFRELNDQK